MKPSFRLVSVVWRGGGWPSSSGLQPILGAREVWSGEHAVEAPAVASTMRNAQQTDP